MKCMGPNTCVPAITGNLCFWFCSTPSLSNQQTWPDLTLQACKRTNRQFACENSFCVNMDTRCDGKVDRRETSDEQECGILFLEPGFNEMLTPPPLDRSPDLLVNISSYFVSLQNSASPSSRGRLLYIHPVGCRLSVVGCRHVLSPLILPP